MSTNKHNCSRTVAPTIIIHKDHGCTLPPMPTVPRPIAILIALTLPVWEHDVKSLLHARRLRTASHEAQAEPPYTDILTYWGGKK